MEVTIIKKDGIEMLIPIFYSFQLVTVLSVSNDGNCNNSEVLFGRKGEIYQKIV